MTAIKRSVEIIGDVIALIVGGDMDTPVLREMEDHLFWYI